ncbi:hypothetical protein BJY59DRAFT_688908 [Rhodotorula toruloides]
MDLHRERGVRRLYRRASVEIRATTSTSSETNAQRRTFAILLLVLPSLRQRSAENKSAQRGRKKRGSHRASPSRGMRGILLWSRKNKRTVSRRAERCFGVLAGERASRA